jgi:hypothetical protein
VERAKRALTQQEAVSAAANALAALWKKAGRDREADEWVFG